MKIAASRLQRVLMCEGSFELEEGFERPPQTEAALEGEAAHEAAELILTGQFQLAEELVDRKMSNGVYVTRDMIDHVETYVTHVVDYHGFEQACDVDLPTATDNPVTLTGVCDAWKHDGTTVTIADFKYGFRPVDVEENWQLIAYAIAFRAWFPAAESFVLEIIQPRAFHRHGPVRSVTYSAEKIDWFTRRMCDALNTRDKTLTRTGEHCRYCRAFARCGAVTAASYNAVDVAHTASTVDLDGHDTARVVSDLRRAQALIKEKLDVVEADACQMVRNGTPVPGFLVSSRYGRTTWIKGLTADAVQAATGVDPRTDSMVTPAQLKKRGAPKDVVDSMSGASFQGFKLVEASTAQSDANVAFNSKGS